jgi:hypothetical protein
MVTMKQLVPPSPSGDVKVLNLLVREVRERPVDLRTSTPSKSLELVLCAIRICLPA